MEFKCIGIRQVDFKGNDGNQVSGLNLWLSYEDPHVDGVAVDKIFIPLSRVPRLTFVPDVGASCRVVYNKFGKVHDIEFV